MVSTTPIRPSGSQSHQSSTVATAKLDVLLPSAGRVLVNRNDLGRPWSVEKDKLDLMLR